MEHTIVVLRFNDFGQARHALDEQKRLDRKRRFQVGAAALMGGRAPRAMSGATAGRR
jgi:hypothetical protein